MENQDNLMVMNAVWDVMTLYGRSPFIEAFRLAGKSPRERAAAAWARLKHRKVSPKLPVAAWLAVEMALRDDPPPGDGTEFKLVQAAKVIHRMGGGSHRRWEHERRNGRGVWIEEMHVYPRSRGWVLRHMGADLEKAVGGLPEFYLRSNPKEDDAVYEAVDQPVSEVPKVPDQQQGQRQQEAPVKPEGDFDRPLMAPGPWWNRP